MEGSIAAPTYVVRISGQTANGAPFNGTGFLVSAQGYVVTCWHVVADAAEIWVKLPYEKPWRYQVCDRSAEDIVLLQGLVPPVPPTPSAPLHSAWREDTHVGDRVTVWGYSAPEHYDAPQKIDCAVSSFSGTHGRVGLNGDINPGDSGAPVIGGAGKVIGIAQAKDPKRNGQAMAIPISLLLDLLGSTSITVVPELRRQSRPALLEPQEKIQPHTNLPHPLTSFVGREREMAEIERLLATARLVTLTGPGGCGKTRLALQVAWRLLERFNDGVYSVSLVSIRDAELVATEIARTLGVREEGSRPLLQSLKDHLQNKRALLLLDNLEQVLSAVPLVVDLLEACSFLRVLVTSRAVLRGNGEHEFPVPPLSLPDPKHLLSPDLVLQSAAVALFVDRAKAVNPEFEVTHQDIAAVTAICTRLDGLPLAIELAAARIRLFSSQAMLTRLDNRLKLLTSGPRNLHDRHRTLRVAIDWSYDLLTPEEQALFRRLACFVGGWTLEVAEAVCLATGDLPLDILGGIGSLVDNSLVQSHSQAGAEPRFSMLETIREYAFDHLLNSGELELTQRAHSGQFLALAEEADRQLRGPQQTVWLALLETEHDNARAALDWCISSGDADTALRLAGALSRFWHVRGHVREARDRLEAVLAMPGAPTRKRARMKVLSAAGGFAYDQGDFQRAATLHNESLSIARACGDGESIAIALNNLGNLALDQGNGEQATALYQQALTLWRSLANNEGIAMVLNNLGGAAQDRGEYEKAASYFEESLGLKRSLGDQRGIANSLNNLGNLATNQGAYSQAAVYLDESLRVFRALGDSYGTVMSLDNLADLALEQGQLSRAAELRRECLSVCEELGNWQAIAESLEGLAHVVGRLGFPLKAARLYGAAEVLREAVGSPLSASERTRYEPKVADTQDGVDDSAWAAAWAEGRGTSLPQAIALSLEVSVSSEPVVK